MGKIIFNISLFEFFFILLLDEEIFQLFGKVILFYLLCLYFHLLLPKKIKRVSRVLCGLIGTGIIIICTKSFSIAI
jgi:hypothetical protein